MHFMHIVSRALFLVDHRNFRERKKIKRIKPFVLAWKVLSISNWPLLEDEARLSRCESIGLNNRVRR